MLIATVAHAKARGIFFCMKPPSPFFVTPSRRRVSVGNTYSFCELLLVVETGKVLRRTFQGAIRDSFYPVLFRVFVVRRNWREVGQPEASFDSQEVPTDSGRLS